MTFSNVIFAAKQCDDLVFDRNRAKMNLVSHIEYVNQKIITLIHYFVCTILRKYVGSTSIIWKCVRRIIQLDVIVLVGSITDGLADELPAIRLKIAIQ